MKANTKSLWTRDTRAQVGIGTMIVFIATILVAATAAAVLIDTSGKLSERSSSTGNEATKQVSSNLVVKNIAGLRLAAGNNLQYLNITIGLAPGASPVDMTQLKIQMDDGSTTDNFDWNSGTTSTATANEFDAVFERDADTSANTMTAGDLVDIEIDLQATGITLAARKDVTLTLLPEVGTPVDASFTTPSSYGSDLYIILR